MITTTVTPKANPMSSSPILSHAFWGRSMIHSGREPAVMVLASAWLTSQLR
jgi:hypothetical protein